MYILTGLLLVFLLFRQFQDLLFRWLKGKEPNKKNPIKFHDAKLIPHKGTVYKLYWHFGAMNASKTAQLLMTRHNYESQGKRVLLMKPALDDRFDQTVIQSRIGLKADADVLLRHDSNLLDLDLTNIFCVLVDEAQFLNPGIIDQLRLLTLKAPVMCYGLRTDFTGNLFPAAARLMAIADVIHEIKTICVHCNRKAIINAKFIMKHDQKQYIKESHTGTVIDLGAEEKYDPLCWYCWHSC